MKIDEQYFQNYAGRNKSYDEVFEEHSYAPECVDYFNLHSKIEIKSVAVLGAATGKVLPFFKRAFGDELIGCELNKWAHSQIPEEFRKSIQRSNMLDFVHELYQKGEKVDLVFSNAFLYLELEELAPFLQKLSRICRYVHYRSSFAGDACPDPYRKILKPFKWWDEEFKKAGFQSLGVESYVWELED